MAKPMIDDRTVEGCRRGDQEAFRLLFEAHRDRVYSIALCFFDGNEATAKDVTQEVFLKLMTTIGRFQNRSQFSTWLYRVVRNACLDRRRSLRRLLSFGDNQLESAAGRESIEDRYIQGEMERSVR